MWNPLLFFYPSINFSFSLSVRLIIPVPILPWLSNLFLFFFVLFLFFSLSLFLNDLLGDLFTSRCDRVTYLWWVWEFESLRWAMWVRCKWRRRSEPIKWWLNGGVQRERMFHPEVKATTTEAVGFSRKRNICNDPRRWWRLGVVNVPSGSAAIRPSIEPNIPAVPLSISKIKKQTKYYYYYYKAKTTKIRIIII